MNPQTQRSSLDAERMHAHARQLASEAIDIALPPQDSEWLTGHLAGCPDCATVAEEYRALHGELRGLPELVPPRDLWARTSAALDVVDRRSAARAGRSLIFGSPLSRRYVGVAFAAGLIVVVAGASVLSQVPTAKPGGSSPSAALAVVPSSSTASAAAPQEPLAIVDGQGYWIAAAAGVYQIKGGSAECSSANAKCAVFTGGGTILGTIASDTSVSAVMAPDARQAAVWTGTKIVILPLAQPVPATVSIDLLTPRPSSPASFTAAPSPLSSPTPTVKPSAVPRASASPHVAPSNSPTPSPTIPTGLPAVVMQPTAILNGYEIVGRSPEFSADGTWVAFSARPVDHSTGPDVFVWHTGAETALTVTSAHADVFSGWFGPRILISEYSAAGAGAIPSADPSPSAVAPSASPDPSTVAAPSALLSAPTTTSYIFDPLARTAQRIDRRMLLPVVDPTGRYLIYWSGTVAQDAVTRVWSPIRGDLFVDAWSNLTLVPAWLGGPASAPQPSPAASASSGPTSANTIKPSATPTDEPTSTPTSSGQPSATPSIGTFGLPQRLPVTAGHVTVSSWSVRWDAAGQHVAIWVADAGDVGGVGDLRLFAIDPVTGVAEANQPLVAVRAMPNISFDGANLVYTAAGDGKTYLVPVPEPTPSPMPSATPTASPARTATPS